VKGIASFVVILVVGLAVVGYVVTRPVETDLDATEREWVRDFRAWIDTTERRVNAASVGLGFTSEPRNARLVEPLRTCSAFLGRLGEPPDLLISAHEAALDACARAEHAVRLNDRFGPASLATTKLHLNEAGDRLVLARRNLRVQLGGTEALALPQ